MKKKQKFYKPTSKHTSNMKDEGGAGADLGFSRGGGGRIFKKFSKILTTFFFF